MSIYQATLAMVNSHNADTTQTYKLAINEFSDMTYEELKAKYLVDFDSVQGTNKCEQSGLRYTDDIDEIDWQAKGFVQKVKNQGQCGSCWAFATTAGLESAIAIFKKEALPDLSEQELVDCSHEYGNFGCQGGLMGNAYDYILDHHINVQKDYPYKGSDQTCNKKKSGKGTVGLKGCRQVEHGVDRLTEALKQQPVAVAFYVQSDFFSYHSGIYNPKTCAGHPNHGVLAIGFNLKDKLPYYKVKNSWGTKWGDKGFFKMSIGIGHGTCNVAGTDWNYFPVV